MILQNKIVRRTMTNGEPVQIGVTKRTKEPVADAEEKVDELDDSKEDELKAREEQVKLMLADIEGREKTLAQKFIEVQKDEKKLKTKKQMTDAECERILRETNEEAEKIRTLAHDEGYKEGHDKGFADGHKEGTDAAKNELKETIANANKKAEKTIQDARNATADYFVRAENDIAKILIMAIEKILPQHFIDVPKDVLPVLREAINHVRDQKEIKVHVEPDSYDLVLVARNEFQSMLTDGTAVLEIISDDALKPGDCVIETPNGGVDARLSTQIELMKNAIQSVMIEE